MTNPYLDPTADDDLFVDPESPQTPSATHTFGGQPCRKPGCGATHKFIGAERPENLPDAARAELDHLLDQLEPDLRHNALLGIQRLNQPGADQVMESADVGAALDTMTTELTHMNGHAPLLRAMAELVDELSGQQLTPRFRHYQFEHQIIVTKLLQGAIATFVTRHADEMPEVFSQDAVIELRERLSGLQHQIDTLMAEYQAHANAHGLPVDEALVATGTPTPTGVAYVDHTVTTMLSAELCMLGIAHIMRQQ